MNLLFLALLGAPSSAAEPGSVELQRLGVMPRAEVRASLPRPPIVVAERDRGPYIDGIFEGAWQRGQPAANVRSVIYKGPPHPDWNVRAWVSGRGLSLALAAVSSRLRSWSPSIPMPSRRGWLRLSVRDGEALWEDCRASPDDADMPVTMAWSVRTWDCADPVAAYARHGKDGWELDLPWSSLGPTTDDLQLNVRIEDGEHSLSLEPTGSRGDYTSLGRNLSSRRKTTRNDRLVPRWDRTGNRLLATLATQPTGPEVWRWEVAVAGARVVAGRVEVSPENKRAEIVANGVEPSAWPYLVARREGSEPLVPGAWRHLWLVSERGTLATPVYDRSIIARINQVSATKAVPVEVRDASGDILLSTEVDLPSGATEVLITPDPKWPDVVQVRVGDLFPEGWLTAIRRGHSARALGGP